MKLCISTLGADVNALDAVGFTPLMISAAIDVFEPAKLLLEWGVEISLPRNMHIQEENGLSDKDAFIRMAIEVCRGAKYISTITTSLLNAQSIGSVLVAVVVVISVRARVLV